MAYSSLFSRLLYAWSLSARMKGGFSSYSFVSQANAIPRSAQVRSAETWVFFISQWPVIVGGTLPVWNSAAASRYRSACSACS